MSFTKNISLKLLLLSYPVLFIFSDNYVPKNPLIGAIRWDAWIGGANPKKSSAGKQVQYTLGPHQFHYRAPFFSKEINKDSIECNGATQAIMDQEIRYAKQAGIDYWAFCWYRLGDGLDTARTLYLASKIKNKVNWCIILGTQKFDYDSDAEWLIGQFRFTNYQKVLINRPLVYIYGQDNLVTPDQLNSLKKKCLEKMQPAPYFVFMYSNETNLITKADSLGVDAISKYNGYATNNGGPYYPVLPKEDNDGWERYKKTGKKIIPWVTTGRNMKPRIDREVSWQKNIPKDHWVADGTPEQIANNLGNAIRWVKKNPETVEANAIIMYAWNEFDEGGWICPTLGNNTSRIDAIRKVIKESKQ